MKLGKSVQTTFSRFQVRTLLDFREKQLTTKVTKRPSRSIRGSTRAQANTTFRSLRSTRLSSTTIEYDLFRLAFDFLLSAQSMVVYTPASYYENPLGTIGNLLIMQDGQNLVQTPLCDSADRFPVQCKH
jgi:hypothetical protein